MNKKIMNVVLMISIFFLVLTSCFLQDKKNHKPLDKIKDKKENINQYNIDVQFFPEEKTIKGNQRVIYVNNEDIEIDKLYFHLYPNAFKKKETAPFLLDDFLSAYPKGFSEGYINIEEVYADENKGKYSIGGLDSTIMEVSLPYKLDKGDRISIDIKYTIKLPPTVERFGYGNETYNMGNWYPVIAVYDDSGWNLDPYYAIGDPFYTDISNYQVNIRTPKDFIIASTGSILSSEVHDNTIEWKIEASSVRDFAWIASNNFELVEKEVDGILLKMYFIKDNIDNGNINNKALEFAEKALKTFNKAFGEYPYREYSVVETNFSSGMEYPGLVFIGSKYYDKASTDFLETIIVHETAHQWWYGVVGNDQIDEAWLDEGFASYSEIMYVGENYGEERAEEYHRSANEDSFYRTVDSLEDKSVLKPLDEFKTWNDYSLLVYTKGALFLGDIKDKYGKEMFYKILKTYYNRYKFKIATTKGFMNVCEEVTGDDLDGYFEKWLK